MSYLKFEISDLRQQFSGGCIGRVTPVPIPNTAVKPTGADDTASFRCGKVGSRRIYFKKKPARLSSGLFRAHTLLSGTRGLAAHDLSSTVPGKLQARAYHRPGRIAGLLSRLCFGANTK